MRFLPPPSRSLNQSYPSLDRLQPERRTGRKPYPIHTFSFASSLLCPYFGKAPSRTCANYFHDNNLKALCGFECIPSEATFSRYLKILSENISMDYDVLRPMNETFFPRDEGDPSSMSAGTAQRYLPVRQLQRNRQRTRGRLKNGVGRRREVRKRRNI